MKIEKIDHIVLMVKDIKKAKEFFSDLFETQFESIGEVPEMDLESMIETSGIELAAPLLPDGPSAKTLKSRGEGIIAISLTVANLNEAMAEMKSRGIRHIAQVERGGCRGAVYHPKDTFGVCIELIEYHNPHGLVTAMKERKNKRKKP